MIASDVGELDSVHGNRVHAVLGRSGRPDDAADASGGRMRINRGDTSRPSGTCAPPIFMIAAAIVGAIGCGGTVSLDDSETSPSNAPDDAPRAESADVSSSPGAFASPDPSNAFRVIAFVRAIASSGVDARHVEVSISVQVADADAPIPIRDAVVTVGPLGQARVAAQTHPGEYTLRGTGWSPAYELTVERGSAALRGVRLRAPGFHSVRVDAPAADAPRVEWSPRTQQWVDDVGVDVFDLESGSVTFRRSGAPDEGSFALPLTALARKGTYLVKVRRAASVVLATPSSLAFGELEVAMPVSLP